MSPFEAYQTYVALKTHFTSPSYDYFRYGGKMKLKAESFEKRRDKYFFYKLSKHPDVIKFLVANYIATDNFLWIGKLTNSKEAQTNYEQWLARQQSLSYMFDNDICLLNDDFNVNFKTGSEQYPPLLILFNRRKITIETMVILNRLVKYLPTWRKHIEEKTLFPVIDQKITKYSPFISFDENIMRSKLLAHFSNS